MAVDFNEETGELETVKATPENAGGVKSTDSANSANSEGVTAASVDPIEAYLNEVVGEDGEEVGAETEGRQSKDDKGQEAAKQDSTSSKTDGESQQRQTQEGKNTAGPKDLTLADGTVVKAGAERRWYEQRELARREAADLRNTANQLRQNLEQARSELNQLRQMSTAVQGYGQEELAEAVAIHRALKTDPTNALKMLLTEAAKTGIQIPGVLEASKEQALLQQLEAKFAPMLQQMQQQQEQQQSQQALEAEYNEFIRRFPDALQHDELIARMLDADPSVTLTDAYYQLRNAFIERGLDWNRPLAEQIQQSSAAPQQKQAQPPLPNSRVAPNPTPVDVARSAGVASADEDYKSIIRSVMAELKQS